MAGHLPLSTIFLIFVIAGSGGRKQSEPVIPAGGSPQSATRYRTMHHAARTASRNPIFLPCE